MIKLIIDSGADQNAWFSKKYQFGFLPLSIILEGEQYLDKEEISLEELHQAMKKGKMPSTSQPSPGLIKEKIEKYRENGDEVIIVSIWKEISGTYQNNKSVIDEYKETHPEFKVALIDCSSGYVGETLIAIQVSEMVQAGYSFEELSQQAECNVAHISMYVTVNDLNLLVKGGRLSKSAGFMGSALNVKPNISVNEEELF